MIQKTRWMWDLRSRVISAEDTQLGPYSSLCSSCFSICFDSCSLLDHNFDSKTNGDGTQTSWKQHTETSLKIKTLSHDGNSYRRHAFSDRGMVEISRITGVPFAVLVFEVELHEMTSDRSHEHIARLCADGVGEFKDLVIGGATIAHSKVVVGQNSSHRLGHRWLLRHIQNSNRSRHLQASSPQNSQPKKNPKKKNHLQCTSLSSATTTLL